MDARNPVHFSARTREDDAILAGIRRSGTDGCFRRRLTRCGEGMGGLGCRGKIAETSVIPLPDLSRQSISINLELRQDSPELVVGICC